MVQPVLGYEADARRNDSVFAERQAELSESASKMPKPIAGVFPYLMEITTGHIHPWSKALSERSDLVVGCYDLSGSFDPDDADPHYDPQGVYAASERRGRVATVAPQTAAERKAADAAEKKKLREEIEAQVRKEMEAQYGKPAQEVEEEPTAKPAKPKRKPATAKPAAPVEAVVEPTPEIADEVAADTPTLEDAFEDAMRG